MDLTVITYILISGSAKKGLSYGTNFYENLLFLECFGNFLLSYIAWKCFIFIIIYFLLEPILIFLQVMVFYLF